MTTVCIFWTLLTYFRLWRNLMLQSLFMMCVFVLSKLNYFNSIMAGCSQYLLSKLKKVQSSAARLILHTPDLPTPFLCCSRPTVFQLSRESSTNSHYLCSTIQSDQAPRTSQTFFAFTLLLDGSVNLHTLKRSEYHPFAQSPVVRALSGTKLQLHGTNSPLLPVRHPLSNL